MPPKKRAKCLRCRNKVHARGLCQTCYSNAMYLMKSGQRTEREMVEAGLILPALQRGRPVTTDIAREASEIPVRDARRLVKSLEWTLKALRNYIARETGK